MKKKLLSIIFIICVALFAVSCANNTKEGITTATDETEKATDAANNNSDGETASVDNTTETTGDTASVDDTTVTTGDTTTVPGTNTLPGHIEVIDGKHYLNVPVKSDSDTGNGDINSFIALPAPPEYYSYENIKNTVLTNSFTKEQLDALGRENLSDGKLQIVDFNKTDRINALSLIEEHSAVFGGYFILYGDLKNNEYGVAAGGAYSKHTFTLSVKTSSLAYDQAYEFMYRSAVYHGCEEIERDGYKVKKVLVQGQSTKYYYEIVDGDTQIDICVVYLNPENKSLKPPFSSEAPYRIEVLVKNKAENIMFDVNISQFQEDPPFDWILQFAKIND